MQEKNSKEKNNKKKKKFSIDNITGKQAVGIANVAFGILWFLHLLMREIPFDLSLFNWFMLHVIVQCLFFYCSCKLYYLSKIVKALTETKKKETVEKEKNEE